MLEIALDICIFTAPPSGVHLCEKVHSMFTCIKTWNFDLSSAVQVTESYPVEGNSSRLSPMDLGKSEVILRFANLRPFIEGSSKAFAFSGILNPHLL